MAIIELGGWIEESMDAIIRECAKKNLKQQKNIKYLEDNIIEPIFGFTYNKHLKRMMINLIGLITYDKLETSLDQNKLSRLKTGLGNLKTVRDELAHTFISGTTPMINAPSVTISQFDDIYEGLTDIEHKLGSINL
ncbi:endoribonuclease [Candidatus Magnetoovum chiemensis]|nr:endoribonuclease [Candidatus Magnetoovum chiemensis]